LLQIVTFILFLTSIYQRVGVVYLKSNCVVSGDEEIVNLLACGAGLIWVKILNAGIYTYVYIFVDVGSIAA